MNGELAVLARAHHLFGNHPEAPGWVPAESMTQRRFSGTWAGAQSLAYRRASAEHQADGSAARSADDELMRILTDAGRDHRRARLDTGTVLAAAHADTAIPDNPIAAREMLRRRLIRLRTQRRHVLVARAAARRRRAALLALRYRHRPGTGRGGRAQLAVRAALSRLGCPYVWGATGPDRFDCSGLVSWAYGRAGVPLHRTTFEQIHDGIAVSPAQIRPGDLVFPHAGHVQLAIGHNLVVEAPYAGATVRISTLGPAMAIRRPL